MEVDVEYFREVGLAWPIAGLFAFIGLLYIRELWQQITSFNWGWRRATGCRWKTDPIQPHSSSIRASHVHVESDGGSQIG